MAKIFLKFDGDEKNAVQAIERLNALLAKTTEENRKLKDQSKQASDEQKTGAASAVSSLTRWAAGVVSIGAAWNLAKREYEDYVAMQQRSLDTQTKIADAQRSFITNLGLVSGAERQAAMNRVEGISRSAGVPLDVAYRSAGSAVSARGAASVQQALDATAMAAAVAPGEGATVETLSGALLDMAKATGTRDTKQNLGFLLQVGQQSRGTTLQQLSQHAVPAIIGVNNRGGSVQEAAALVATLTSQAADPEMRMSGTAAIQLANQLSESFPAESRYGFDGKGRRVLQAEGTGLTSTAQRIAYVQKNKEARERFLAKASFEAKAIAPIEQLLAGDTETAQLFAQNVAGLPSMADAATGADEMLAAMGGIAQQKIVAGRRRVESIGEANEFGDVRGGRTAAARAAVERGLLNAHRGWTRRTEGRLEFESRLHFEGQEPEAAAIGVLQRELSLTENIPASAAGSARDSDNRAAMREVIEELRAIRQNQRTTNNPNAHAEK